MKNTKDKNYDLLLSKAVNLLEERGFENIRANMDTYEPPATLSQRNSDVSFTPDLTASNQRGKCYFEIVSKDKKNQNELVSKWKLLSRLAQMKNGTFYLLVPRGTMRFATQVTDEYNISADLLKLQVS